MRLLILLTLVLGLNASAATRMGDESHNDYYKIDKSDKHVDAKTADESADKHTVTRCRYIKHSEPAAYKCEEVVKEYSAKNGNPKWVRP